MNIMNLLYKTRLHMNINKYSSYNAFFWITLIVGLLLRISVKYKIKVLSADAYKVPLLCSLKGPHCRKIKQVTQGLKENIITSQNKTKAAAHRCICKKGSHLDNLWTVFFRNLSCQHQHTALLVSALTVLFIHPNVPQHEWQREQSFHLQMH